MVKATTDDGGGWKVACSCGAIVAEGSGAPPTQIDLVGMAADLAVGHPAGDLGQKIAAHLQESGGGVHRLQVVARGRVTEKL